MKKLLLVLMMAAVTALCHAQEVAPPSRQYFESRIGLGGAALMELDYFPYEIASSLVMDAAFLFRTGILKTGVGLSFRPMFGKYISSWNIPMYGEIGIQIGGKHLTVNPFARAGYRVGELLPGFYCGGGAALHISTGRRIDFGLSGTFEYNMLREAITITDNNGIFAGAFDSYYSVAVIAFLAIKI